MKSENSRPVCVRFAPSPTGHLHIGSLRTALFNWLFARHHNGTFLVRIEDTDVARSTKEFENSLLQSLEWSGIISDNPLVYQSSRTAVYQKVANDLVALGKAYHCYCSQEELQKKRERAEAAGTMYQYDKHCRNVKQSAENE